MLIKCKNLINKSKKNKNQNDYQAIFFELIKEYDRIYIWIYIFVIYVIY